MQRIFHTFSNTEKHCAVAYLDLSCSPEIECWLYSTIQDFSPSLDTTNVTANFSKSEALLCDDLILAILGRARFLGPDVPNPRLVGPSRMVLGSLDEAMRLRLGGADGQDTGSAGGIDWEFCGEWLFWAEELLGVSEAEQAWVWDVVKKGNILLIQSRTHIPRQGWAFCRLF